LLNVLQLTEPRSAVAEIDLGNTPLTPALFFLPLPIWREEGVISVRCVCQDVPDGGMSAGLQLMFPVFFAF
jgi:hypothetical protein